MSKVLVAYSSRQGATGEIAKEVMHELIQRDLIVDFRPVAEVSGLAGYDAVVLGSGIHLRHWDSEAAHFLRRHASDLSRLPTWLFQSGPYDHRGESQHCDPPRAIAERAAQIGAEPPKVFTGNLTGPIRNCDDVKAWTDQIADKLVSGRVTSV